LKRLKEHQLPKRKHTPPGDEARRPLPGSDISPDDGLPADSLKPGEGLEALCAPLPVELSLEAETGGPGSKAGVRGEVVPYDPLQAYLREIRAYPPLSREEEQELSIRYYRHRDLEAAYRLVTGNLWLVVKIARDYEKAARSLLDLIQEGNIGLMEAVKNFDPYRGVRFPSYAVWWIRAYIVRYIIANWRLVKIGTTQAQRKLFFNLHKEKEKLEREGVYPEPKLLAEKLNVKEGEVVDMEQRLSSSEVSMDVPLQSDSDTNLLSLLPASELTAEELLNRKQERRLVEQGLAEFAATLKAKELVIFKERMLGEDKATLQEVADKLSLSKERIRQIEKRLQEKLKDFLSKKLGSLVESLDF